MEKELLEKINDTGIGPAGLGGRITALAVNINTYATHIAGLPVGINICCHVNRHASVTIYIGGLPCGGRLFFAKKRVFCLKSGDFMAYYFNLVF